LILISIRNSEADQYYVNGTNFHVYASQWASIGFQMPLTKIISIRAISGNINGSNSLVWIDSLEGHFTTTLNETATVEVNYSPSINSAHLQGIFMNSGDSLSIMAGSILVLDWDMYTGGEPVNFLVPINFLFGMIGLASMFIGPMYGVYKIKHKEFQSGFVTATVLTILGLALFIAWLWGSA
jgi:hypothetical protein